jgi:hypothetical protein
LGKESYDLKMKRNLLSILLVTFSMIVSVDILIRIWFGKFHQTLSFNPENFNNIVSPFVGMISLLFFGYTVLETIRINKVLMSQNLRPHFEKEIDRIELMFSAKSDNLILTGNKYSINEFYDLLISLHKLKSETQEFSSEIMEARERFLAEIHKGLPELTSLNELLEAINNSKQRFLVGNDI